MNPSIKDIITGIISIVLGMGLFYCASYSEHITVLVLGGITMVVGVLYGGLCMAHAAMNWDYNKRTITHKDTYMGDADPWTHHGMS